ncbi:outer membrane autotransporter barrel domain protein [Fusobacterium necrophorum subsp. funduliforme ATCC 51357]|uniref:Autotransporter outer membrane beta-barrel domain-containing protein n=2 Tax=Fusobacterium necrophorum TaxID=859 RepID=A0A162IV37_9FUSO|nr:autotransporter outer membrane beta-barrel domain-containing protein [Fusobacterium necrophorum]AYV92617.1 autotransporter outer membrane beta-barrel domain-containing protein [Fusobacterium necrophorum subsp. funduliforme]EIJ72231.1 outer membrane autotransporter barrel domain protein [Fusobacterium necrophorum subsp. funduliforme ATCC 51357]KAB0553736.1 autotransporter outer membrane beta-barrel domain-containing protein [Fusobacterium necrophorum subsp. funduliforme]KYL04515.1 autotranspo
MTGRNKKYWSMLSYLFICSTAFSVNPKIIQNEIKKEQAGKIILKHDFTEADKKAKENQDYVEQLIEEEKIKDRNIQPFLNVNSGEKALARTGVIFDFNKEEDEKTPSLLQGKDIEIEEGVLQAIGNPWSYSGNREAIIENSTISLRNNRGNIQYYRVFSDLMNEAYYQFMPDGEKKKLEDADKEFFELGKRGHTRITVENAKFLLKNSKIHLEDKGRDSYTIHVQNQFTFDFKTGNKKFTPAKTGFRIIRDGAKLSEGEYDLELKGNESSSGYKSGDTIFVGSTFEDNWSGLKYYDKDSVLDWYQKRYHKTEGTPIFLLGKNTKLKAGQLQVNFFDEFAGRHFSYPELMKITYNPEEDKMIVFEEGSELNLRQLAFNFSNVKFEGGKVNLKTDYESNYDAGIAFFSGYSQIMGKAIFDIEGFSFLRGESGTRWVDKKLIFTKLDFLPNSKMDVSYIKDGARNGRFEGNAGISNIRDKEIKGGSYGLTFHENTKLYLGYSKRALEKEMENASSDEKKKMLNGIGLTHASDADMNFKKGSHLYLYRDKYRDTKLKKEGKVSATNDERGNLLEFTGKLTFHDSDIYLRSNTTEELSDRLIATEYPILGEGAKLSIRDHSTEATGKEKIIVIVAKKGTSGNTKFILAGGKTIIHGKDYQLYERLSENGEKEYYLAHGVIENVRPENGKPKTFTSEIPNTADFITVTPFVNGENIRNKKWKVEQASDEYAIQWTGDMSIDNSQVLAKGGKGILIKDSKVSTKSSSVMSDQGLALDGKNNEKDLLTMEEKSSLILENSTGGAALALKNAGVKLNKLQKVALKGNYAIYSNAGLLSGSGVFDIDGNVYHKGKGGINLVFEKDSIINAPTIDIAGNRDSSKLHFKAGSRMFISNYSNANMFFDQGSEIHFYTRNQERENLDILHHGNKVIFTEPIHFDNTHLYFRTNIDKEESDQVEILGALTGTSANLHLKNHAESEMPAGGKEVKLIYTKTPENFTWNLANQVEVGGYFYDAVVEKTSAPMGQDVISVRIGDAGTRKATLSSTAKGMISNTVSDYTIHHSLQDSIFDSLYSNDYSSERKNSIWAKTSADTFETKDYGMKNEANTILVGMDRALNAEEGLYGGFFAGNLHNTKKISSSSGKGSFQGFTGGLYLSYRGYLGFGDAFVAYTTGKSKYNVLDTASDTVTNDRNSKHLGAGLRFGRQFFMDSGEHFYLEPSAKITYGRLQGESSEASNGLLTKVDAIKSWTTGAYARAGYQNQFAFGKINSYAKIGVTQEILGKYNVRLNQSGVEQIKLDGNTMNYGLGCEYTIGNNTLSLDFDVKHSPVLKNHYKVSVGYQYKF